MTKHIFSFFFLAVIASYCEQRPLYISTLFNMSGSLTLFFYVILVGERSWHLIAKRTLDIKSKCKFNNGIKHHYWLLFCPKNYIWINWPPNHLNKKLCNTLLSSQITQWEHIELCKRMTPWIELQYMYTLSIIGSMEYDINLIILWCYFSRSRKFPYYLVALRGDT